MLKIHHFWSAIELFWLRRLTYSESTWAVLHMAETQPHTFNPVTSATKNKTSNPVWKKIYKSLLMWRRNLLDKNPLEYLTLPINGEPGITKNYTAIQQPWCENMTINNILDKNGNIKDPENANRPFLRFWPLKGQLVILLKNHNLVVAELV